MAQDIVADALNQIMNAKRIEKRELEISRYSKLLLNLFEIMKKQGHIEYEVIDDKSVKVKLIKLNECKAIKPRFHVKKDDVEKYLRRYLPSRNFGLLVVSTSDGLMGHHEAIQNKTGGSVIAYFY